MLNNNEFSKHKSIGNRQKTGLYYTTNRIKKRE